MTQKELILVGGGGHCRSCIDVIEAEGSFRIAGIVDILEKKGTEILGHPVIAADEEIEELIGCYSSFMITLGQIKSPARRIELYEFIKSLGGGFPAIISPHACVSPYAEIGEGTIVMHNAIVNAGARVGRNCILNSACLIEHDAIVGDHTHISTGAIINGEARVGERCFIGSHATLVHNAGIGANSIVGAGTVVLRSIEGDGTYLGYPAKKVK